MKKLLTILFFIPSLQAYTQEPEWRAHNDSLFIVKGNDSIYYNQFMFFDIAIWLRSAVSSAQTLITAKQDAINRGSAAQYLRGDHSLATFPTTTASFTNSTDKNFVTDAKLTVVNNTTGTNSGDNAANTLYSGLVSNANHTGDATGATALTLATVNGNVGSFGSATQVPTYTVNAKGLITAASNTTIAIPQSAVTSLTTDLALKAPLASPAFTGTPTGITAAHVGLGNVTNESKATMFTSPTFTGTPVYPASSIPNSALSNSAVANLSGTNTGDNSANTTYASDYRAANFVAGTNYLAPNGSAAALTSFPTLNQNTTGTAAGLSAVLSFANGGISAAAATSATTGTMTVNMTTSIVTITPTGACTFNASGGVAGQVVTFAITTAGVSSFVLTFGTNFRKTGTLATGTVAARFFSVTFLCINGTIWQETSRTIVQT